MDVGLKDQVVLITGSSSGIGRAAAIAFGIVFLGSPVNRQITGEIIRITGGR